MVATADRPFEPAGTPAETRFTDRHALTVTVTCNKVPDSRTTRGSAWLAIAVVGGVTYEATSRSSAIGALCRELVAGGVPDGSMTVTFDNIAGVMTIASIYRFAGTTLAEGDAPIRRVKWNPYRGPQNAEPAAPAETGIRESQSPVLWEPSPGERAPIVAELSVTAICAGWIREMEADYAG
jgi:hypothetical protein